jgi:Ni,Fe-hydrogenase III large subunit
MHDEADRVARDIVELRDIYDEHAGLQDRFRTAGRVSPELATKLGLLGLAGRASGIARDVRTDFAQPPYDRLNVNIAVQNGGDVAARVAVRFDEALESTRLIAAITAALLDPPAAGDCRVSLDEAPAGRLAIGYGEGWRGPVLVAVESGPSDTIRR